MVALNNAARDARFVRRLHASIGMPLMAPTPIMVDNSAAIQWCDYKAKWSASRHISTQHFAVQDWKRRGHIAPLKVDTTMELADICTKNLPHATHVMLRTIVLGHREATSATYDVYAAAAA